MESQFIVSWQQCIDYHKYIYIGQNICPNDIIQSHNIDYGSTSKEPIYLWQFSYHDLHLSVWGHYQTATWIYWIQMECETDFFAKNL